jgi:hypothetical protein
MTLELPAELPLTEDSGVPLSALEPLECLWPVAQCAWGGEIRFCGENVTGKGSYCPAHRKRAYAQPTT